MEDNNLEEIKKMLVENDVSMKFLVEEMRSVKRYMKVRLIMSIVWVVILVLPTVVAAFYLPDLIKSFSGNLPGIMDTIKVLY